MNYPTIAIISTIVFAISLIIVGYYYRNKRTPEEFFMAGRKVGILRIVSSTFTLVGAGEIITLILATTRAAILIKDIAGYM